MSATILSEQTLFQPALILSKLDFHALKTIDFTQRKCEEAKSITHSVSSSLFTLSLCLNFLQTTKNKSSYTSIQIMSSWSPPLGVEDFSDLSSNKEAINYNRVAKLSSALWKIQSMAITHTVPQSRWPAANSTREELIMTTMNERIRMKIICTTLDRLPSI